MKLYEICYYIIRQYLSQRVYKLLKNLLNEADLYCLLPKA
jgi:hypothetical protein